jgi:hypothetical protein
MALALKPLQEGETLHSNLSRYAQDVCLRQIRPLYLLVFGKNTSFHNRILPNGIERFCDEAREYWRLAPAEFIRGHSGYFYYLLLADEETRQRAQSYILKPPGAAPSNLLVQRQRDPERFAMRYCDGCVADSRSKNKEPYLSVKHQLPGVFFCAQHEMPLRSLRLDPGIHARAEAVTLQRFASSEDPIVVRDLQPMEKLAGLDFSRRSVHLLNGFDKDCIQFPYEPMLKAAGLTAPDGNLDRGALWVGLKEYFGAALCGLLGLDEGAYRRTFWRAYEKDVIRCPRPLRYLALQSFLAYRTTQGAGVIPLIPESSGDQRTGNSWAVFGLSREPTGKARRGVWEVTCQEDFKVIAGKYPCTGSLHRAEDSIEAIEVKPGAGRYSLACTCGRKVSFRPDPADGSMNGLRVDYGERYRQAFEELLRAGEVPNIAARRLGLSSDIGFIWKRQIADYEVTSRVSTEAIAARRADWGQYFLRFPENGVEQAKRDLCAVHAFLDRYDVTWLRDFNARLASARRESLISSNLQKIENAKDQLMAIEPPVWITKSSLRLTAGLSRKATDGYEVWGAALAEKSEEKCAFFDRTIDLLDARSER